MRLVVLVAPFAGEQPQIFDAADRLANAELHGGGGGQNIIHTRCLE